LANEKGKAEIAKLIERLQETTTKIQGCLLKDIRLDELYLYGNELVNMALQIQYFCARISVSASQEIPERSAICSKN
jgi:nucleoside-triphosphatase THEP1